MAIGEIRIVRRSCTQTSPGSGSFRTIPYGKIGWNGVLRVNFRTDLLEPEYVQHVSRENGIPALILFLAVLFGCMKRLNAIVRLGRNPDSNPTVLEAAHLAFWLRTTMIGFMVTSAFLSAAYSELIMTLAGLTVSLERAVHAQLASPAPAPAPLPSRYAVTMIRGCSPG